MTAGIVAFTLAIEEICRPRFDSVNATRAKSTAATADSALPFDGTCHSSLTEVPTTRRSHALMSPSVIRPAPAKTCTGTTAALKSESGSPNLPGFR